MHLSYLRYQRDFGLPLIQVDLQCVSATSRGHYYKSHLPRLGAFQKNTDNAEKNSADEPGCSTEKGDLTGEHSSESSSSVRGITDDTPTQTSEGPAAEHASDCAAADDDSQKVNGLIHVVSHFFSQANNN